MHTTKSITFKKMFQAKIVKQGRRMNGWTDGWMGGRNSSFKVCLQQLETCYLTLRNPQKS
jgi:hypothetical protein